MLLYFSCRTVDVWNSLSDAVVKSTFVSSLKKLWVLFMLLISVDF